jgi:hypothetical protein
MKLVAMVTLLAAGMVYAQSTVTYTIETGGNNNTYQWEAKASPQPFFQSGVTDGSTTVSAGEDLTWAVRVTVSGAHSGTAGNGLETRGAANLVFDLQLFQADGSTPVDSFGAAPLACSSGTLGQVGAKACKPADKGFWSSINDGDTDNPNDPNSQVLDTLANAAFAYGIYAAVPAAAPSVYPAPSGTTPYRLIDAAGSDIINTPAGPNFDYGWYPTSNGRGGIDTEGTKTISTSVTTVNSALVGFGAGYKVYDNTHRAGVGVASLAPYNDAGYGVDRPLFEGQINTTGLTAGTYVLKVVPSADGNNIVHGDVTWDAETPSYGGAGSFAAKANAVVGSQVSFVVEEGKKVTSIAGRQIFYNQSYYDGNKVAIDAAAIAGANNDDADAIDTSKTALLPGAGAATFANYTGYNKGINGLVYDIKDVPAGKTITAADFEFVNQGKAGTASTVVTTATVVTQANTPATGTTRCVITFPNATLTNCWLKVTVKTTVGLTAADVSYWGNVVGEAGVGNSPVTNLLVNANDEVMARPPYTHNALNRAPVTDTSDYNKDSLVNPNDEVLCRPPYTTNALSCVKLITR